MKPILITMDDPLDPLVPNTPGWVVWRLCGEPTYEEYRGAFDRYTFNAYRLNWHLFEARNVVVFGNTTCQALNLPRVKLSTEPMEPNELRWLGTTWYYLPFPSGRCHWYHDPLRWRLASALLKELMEQGLRYVE